MPDPVLYTQVMAVAAVVSALCVLATSWPRPPTASRTNLAGVLGIGGGLVAGYGMLGLRLAWPPVTGLQRLLLILLPAVLVIELVACWPKFPRWFSGTLRIALVICSARILLHGSIYLGGERSSWTTAGTLLLLLLSSSLLAAVWTSLSRLSARSPGISILLALALATQTAAITIMLAGYVTGGAAALPLTATLVGSAAAMALMRTPPTIAGTVSVSVVLLFGLVFVGRFFGGLSTGQALAIVLAPLLCWIPEFAPAKWRAGWPGGLLRLVCVSVPLIVVLCLAKRTFDRDTAPLLGAASAPVSVSRD
jgi:hypothetical protein